MATRHVLGLLAVVTLFAIGCSSADEVDGYGQIDLASGTEIEDDNSSVNSGDDAIVHTEKQSPSCPDCSPGCFCTPTYCMCEYD